MGRISVLITGGDKEYNKSLASALSKLERDFSITCMAEDRFSAENRRIVNEFDMLLMNTSVKASDTEGKKKIILSDTARIDSRDENGCLILFKYRSVKEIARQIKQEYTGTYINDGNRSMKVELGVRLVGILSAGQNLYGEAVGKLLAGALAELGSRVTYFNLAEFPRHVFEQGGKTALKTWDDFIYYSVYGKSRGVLSRTEDFIIREDEGAGYFYHNQSRNPFSQLEGDEIKKFYNSIRGEWRTDYCVMSLPDSGTELWKEAARENDLIVLINEGNRQTLEESEMMRFILMEDSGFKGKLLTMCVGGKWDFGKNSDFAISNSKELEELEFDKIKGSETWKELLRLGKFIGDGCIE